jgi:hypothetical protein
MAATKNAMTLFGRLTNVATRKTLPSFGATTTMQQRNKSAKAFSASEASKKLEVRL